MIIEHIHPGCAPDVYRRFRERGRLMPDGVRYVSSWVDLDFRRCFQIIEAPGEDLVHAWTANWADLIDFEVVPVRTSRDAEAAIAPHL